MRAPGPQAGLGRDHPVTDAQVRGAFGAQAEDLEAAFVAGDGAGEGGAEGGGEGG